MALRVCRVWHAASTAARVGLRPLSTSVSRVSEAQAALSSAIVQPALLDPALDALAAQVASNAISARGLANLIGTAALVGRFHEGALHAAFGDALLRNRLFTDSDLVILHHVVVAMRLRSPGGPAHGGVEAVGVGRASPPPLRLPPVPLDVTHALHNAAEAEALRSQALYDLVGNALRRAGYRYTYRSRHVGTGYTLPLSVTRPGTGTSLALSIDGPYNCLPGSDEPSLASRLWEANLRLCGTGVVRITPSEAARCLGGGGGGDVRSIDAFPDPTTRVLTPRPQLRNPSTVKLLRGAARAPPLPPTVGGGGGGGGGGEGTSPTFTLSQRAAAAREAAQSLDALLAAILAQLDAGGGP